MDIWTWVNEAVEALGEGAPRLAQLVDDFPGLVLDLEHEQVDAAYPEALALSRQAKSPWLEVFFRHWYLQSRVFHRQEASPVLAEAVDALEFAHRDESRDCPQSVCITQDLARCYANLDGPGYVEERLAVAGEALARITPQWPCFSCISGEWAGALLDDGRPGEAVSYLARQEEAMRGAGARPSTDFRVTQAEALVRAGRPAEGLERLAGLDDESPHESERLTLMLRRAGALTALGRRADAVAQVPPYEAVVKSPALYKPWLELIEVLAGAGAVPNDARLHRQLVGLERRVVPGGTWRLAFDLARVRAELALKRGHAFSVANALGAMREAFARLKKQGTASETIDRVAAALAALEARPATGAPPASPEAVLGQSEDDVEAALAALLPALERWPSDERLRCEVARKLWTLGHFAEGEAVLRRHLEEVTADATAVVCELFDFLSENGRSVDARAIVEQALKRWTGDAAQALAHRMLAAWACRWARGAGAVEHLRRAVALEPNPNTVAWLAERERKDGDLEGALRRLDEAVARWPDAGNHDWERIIAATLLERWPEARASAQRLGFEFEGTGPFDEALGTCRVELSEGDEESVVVWCERIGPVSARVLSIAGPGAVQHAGDELVFEPVRLKAAPEGSDEASEVPLYRAVQVTRPGRCRAFSIEGVHPGEPRLEALREALRETGARMAVLSESSYLLTHPTKGELPGLYARVAVPPAVSAARVAEVLETGCAGLPHPLAWPGLLEQLGHPAAAHAQRDLAAEYGITLDVWPA